eukprot:1043957-Pleurochrysis_carterae.AAC.1
MPITAIVQLPPLQVDSASPFKPPLAARYKTAAPGAREGTLESTHASRESTHGTITKSSNGSIGKELPLSSTDDNAAVSASTLCAREANACLDAQGGVDAPEPGSVLRQLMKWEERSASSTRSCRTADCASGEDSGRSDKSGCSAVAEPHADARACNNPTLAACQAAANHAHRQNTYQSTHTCTRQLTSPSTQCGGQHGAASRSSSGVHGSAPVMAPTTSEMSAEMKCAGGCQKSDEGGVDDICAAKE